jgi:type IV secretion system protein VirB9
MKCLLLLAALAASPVIARDARVAARYYDPAHIVTVHAHTGIQSTIAFGPDERIENVAVGDSATWQVTPNKRASIVFVKPMQPSARTNMTVVTDRRTYLFDLVATPRGVPVYMLRFTYPAEPKPVVAMAPPPPAPAAPATEMAAKAPEPTPADLNFAWVTAGAKQLLPARVFDDGKSTWLAWPKDSSMPAILAREPNGDEGPVNYTVRGDYMVVDGIPAQLVLRQGKLMATLTPAPRTSRPAPAVPALPPAAQTASLKP